MALTLTSCEYAREPGFSRTEALDLAKRLEAGDIFVWPDVSPRERQTIIAALREHAG